MAWKARHETVVQVSLRERELYATQSTNSAFDRFHLSERKGIHSSGEFPVAVMRAVYEALGYETWMSGQSKLGDDTYLLMRLPGKRREGDAAYQRIIDVFGADAIRDFDQIAKRARIQAGFRSAGGDPDLFVRHRTDRSLRFFVEVKREDFTKTPVYRDTFGDQQLLLFPLIEKRLKCQVRVARVQIVSGG